MSFGGSGGFNFSLPTTTTSSGFSFSNAAPKPTNPPSGGFPFGATGTSGFSFGTPSTSVAGGSSFGISTASTLPASTAGSGFGITASTAAGTSFGLPSASTVAGSTFGIATAPTTAVSNFGMPSAPAAGGSLSFNLGSGSTAVSSSSGGISNFSLNNSMPSSTASQSTGSFNFTLPSSTGLTSSTAPQISIPPMSTGPGFKLTTSSSLLSTPSQNANTSISASSVANPLQVQPSTTTSASFGGFQLPTSSAAAPSLGLFSSGTSAFSVTGTTSTSAAGTATLSTATTTSSLGGTGAGGGPNLSMRQLEEKLNKWLVELKEQEERFIRQAAHVNAWDQILQNGHDQVQSLKDTLHTVKSDQSRLEAELDFIRGQQEELERLLDPLEAAVISTPATQLHQGDRQRDNMYHLALNLDGQLRQMTDDLGKVIEHLNSGSGSSQPNDPVNLVARILSAHMDSLKWVDQNTALLSQKMEDLSRVTSDAGRRV